jgi:hypothetical protein
LVALLLKTPYKRLMTTTSSTNTTFPTSLIGAAFSAVGMNEVSGNAANADRLTQPNPQSSSSAHSGWSIGFDQEDFAGNASVAQATLVAALTASGNFSPASAAQIAANLTAAGTSNSPTFTGITDNYGNPVTVQSINTALASPAAAASIQQSSLNNFTSLFVD